MSSELGGFVPGVTELLVELLAEGLLTDRHTLNHCADLSDRAWDALAAAGAAVNVSPRSDATYGLTSSVPPVEKALLAGLTPGLSSDGEVSYGAGPFADMNEVLLGHRAWAQTEGSGAKVHLTPADVLGFATRGGAANAGLAEEIGSLTPGRAADLVLIRGTDVNTVPMTDPATTVTAVAHAGNVDTVLVAGRVRKFRGALVGVDLGALSGLVAASRDRLVAARNAAG